MSFRFGWLSTGRDLAARQLLQATWERMEEGVIPGEITFVFCDRERGDAEGSDLFLDLVEESSGGRETSLPAWRGHSPARYSTPSNCT